MGFRSGHSFPRSITGHCSRVSIRHHSNAVSIDICTLNNFVISPDQDSDFDQNHPNLLPVGFTLVSPMPMCCRAHLAPPCASTSISTGFLTYSGQENVKIGEKSTEFCALCCFPRRLDVWKGCRDNIHAGSYQCAKNLIKRWTHDLGSPN